MSVVSGRVPEVRYVLFLSILIACGAHAQSRAPLTLAEAEGLAIAGEPGQAALLAWADAYREQAVAAGQLPDPTFKMGLANFPISGGGFSTEGMTQAQLGMRQEFPRARVRELGTERLQWMAHEKSAAADARTWHVLAAARTAWLEIYYWQRADELMRASRPFFADLVTITRSMYSVGRKTQHDVLRAELELSRLDDRLIEAGRARSARQASLAQWLAEDAYRPVAMRVPAWEDLPALEDLERALAAHPLLNAADAGVAVGQSAVELAKESARPGWAVDLAYGFRDGLLQSGQPRSDFVSLAVTVDLPFFGRKRRDKQLSAALHARRAAVETRAELLSRLNSELGAEYARWSELTRRLALYESRILGQSKGQARAALLAYQSDAGDFSDVMRGYIDDLNTRLEHIRLIVERAQSYAALANLAGVLE